MTTTHKYTLNGSQIIKETVFVNNTETYTLVYLYDETGSPIGYRYRTPSYADGVFDGYFFEKNLQGDVVAVYNQNGVKVAGYIYDAWGSCATTYYNGGANTAAQYNPFRYRGYYYDSETGLYYLQSRYYDSAMGRFINADNQLSGGDLLGYNLYAYCGNNPVNRIDSEGQFWLTIILATVVLTAVTVMMSSCGNQNEGLEGTPADPKARRSFDSYDDAVNTMISECYQTAMDNGFKYEYGAVIFQYEGDSRFYTNGVDTDYMPDRIYFENKYPHGDKTVKPVADIHTHPYNVAEPFREADMRIIEKYGVNAYIAEKGENGLIFVRMLPKTASKFDQWVVYSWGE